MISVKKISFKKSRRQRLISVKKITLKKLWGQRYLFLMVLPGFLVILVFNYFPMYGILLAFKDYNIVKGIWASPWVGFSHFYDFFKDPMAFRVLKNTLLLGLNSLFWGFPAPIILALLFNELTNKTFKKISQTITYFPNFISVVIIAGMLKEFCSREGFFNQIVKFFGGNPTIFLLEPRYFRTIFVSSSIWQSVGFGSIIYLAALNGADPTLYEVADIDGASRWQKVVNVTWPAIRPTTIILLLFSLGGILGTDFQKIILLYSPDTYSVADVIGSYVYREGILGAKFEYTTAIGLFMSGISFIILYLANFLSRKFSETSLW